MANKRQKKKKLKNAVQVVTKFVNDFPKIMEAEIKKNPWEVKKKLLEMDEPNPWTFLFIVRCNEEISKRSQK